MLYSCTHVATVGVKGLKDGNDNPTVLKGLINLTPLLTTDHCAPHPPSCPHLLLPLHAVITVSTVYDQLAACQDNWCRSGVQVHRTSCWVCLPGDPWRPGNSVRVAW